MRLYTSYNGIRLFVEYSEVYNGSHSWYQMKYTKTKLEELKHIRHSARAEHRAFLEARPYPNNFSQRAGILKEKRDSTRKIYHKYRKRYSNYKLSKRRIKKYKKEMKRSEEKRMNESLIMCQCLDNIAVETNHSSVEELLRNAITSYTREQPVRFEGVLPFIMAYDNSSKLYKVHEAAGEHSMNKLESELIKMNNIF